MDLRPQCEEQVKGFTSAKYKKFNTYNEAVNFVLSNGGTLDHKIDVESSSNDTTVQSNKVNKRPSDDSNDTTNPSKKPKKDNGELPVKKLSKYGGHSFLEDEDGYVHVFTDGSCEGNGTKKAVAGLGVYFGEGHALYV